MEEKKRQELFPEVIIIDDTRNRELWEELQKSIAEKDLHTLVTLLNDRTILRG